MEMNYGLWITNFAFIILKGSGVLRVGQHYLLQS